MINPLKALMPAIYAHQGVWEGEYQHLNLQGEVLDRHASRVECVFPEAGEVVYVQNNHFTWADGREQHVSFDGVLQDDRIHWDTDTFYGYGWQANDSVFLLELQRKDIADASFTEIIVLGQDGKHRVRTWHWFKDGQCFQRTCCNERLVS